MSRYNIHTLGPSADHRHRQECGTFSVQCRQRRVDLTCACVCLHRATSSPSHLRGRLLVSTRSLPIDSSETHPY